MNAPSFLPDTDAELDSGRLDGDERLSNGVSNDGLVLLPSAPLSPDEEANRIPTFAAALEIPCLPRKLGNLYLSSCPGKKGTIDVLRRLINFFGMLRL